MLLPTQIQSILYHFLMGWVYGLCFSFVITFSKYIRSPFLKGIIEIGYHIAFTFLMFYGLYIINGGITNIYLVVIFLLGVIVYYAFYLTVFLDFFVGIKRFLRPFRMKMGVVKRKILAIIRVPKKMMKRRRANAKRKHRKNEREEQTEETPI